MMNRTTSRRLSVAMIGAIALWLVNGQNSVAEQKGERTVAGTVKKVGEQSLIIQQEDPEGGRQQIEVGQGTKITLNDKEIGLDALKRGDKVTVTTSKGDRKPAAAIEVSRKKGKRRQATRAEQPGEQREAGEEEEPPAVLGVVIVKPRGEDQVTVLRVAPESPADRAGLRPGDEVVEVDGREITSPSQLGELIAEKKPGEKVKITFDRDGEERTARVRLARRSELLARREQQPEAREEAPERPEERRRQRAETEEEAWLGVLLAEDEQEGARIMRVVPDGPAAEAGLERGDVIRRIEGKRIRSPRAAGEAIEKRKPGQKVKIVVLRDGEEETVTAELAAREDRGERRRLGRPPFLGEPEMWKDLEEVPQMFPQRRRMERILRDLQEEVERLREEVAELKDKAASQ